MVPGKLQPGIAFLEDERHDYMAQYPERGPKVIFQTTGGFGSGGRDFTENGEGPAEIDTVVDIIFAHTDSEGQNTVARRTAFRLLEFLCHDEPSLAVVVRFSGWTADRKLRHPSYAGLSQKPTRSSPAI